MEKTEVSITGLRDRMGLPEDFHENEQRMTRWRFQAEDGSEVVATIDVSDEGEEMLLDFTRAIHRNGASEDTKLQFSAWYTPGSDRIALIANGEGDMESQFEAFQADFTAEHLLEIA